MWSMYTRKGRGGRGAPRLGTESQVPPTFLSTLPWLAGSRWRGRGCTSPHPPSPRGWSTGGRLGGASGVWGVSEVLEVLEVMENVEKSKVLEVLKELEVLEVLEVWKSPLFCLHKCFSEDSSMSNLVSIHFVKMWQLRVTRGYVQPEAIAVEALCSGSMKRLSRNRSPQRSWSCSFTPRTRMRPALTSLLRRALPSKSLLGDFSSRVRSSLAAERMRARLYLTLHT